MPPIAIIQNTVASTPWSELDEPVRRRLQRVADAGYDGIEMSGGGLRGLDVDEFKRELDRVGLEVVGTHFGNDLVDGRVELSDAGDGLEGDLETTVEAFRTLGTDALVTGSPAGEYVSERDLETKIAALAELADRMEAHGAKLHYHNHTSELRKIGGRTVLYALMDEIDNLLFQPDIGHIARADRDPATVLRHLAGRISLVHFSDADLNAPEKPIVEIGDGDIDMAGCARAGRDAGADWFIYEYNQTTDHLTTIEHGAEFLSEIQG